MVIAFLSLLTQIGSALSTQFAKRSGTSDEGYLGKALHVSNPKIFGIIIKPEARIFGYLNSKACKKNLQLPGPMSSKTGTFPKKDMKDEELLLKSASL